MSKQDHPVFRRYPVRVEFDHGWWIELHDDLSITWNGPLLDLMSFIAQGAKLGHHASSRIYEEFMS